MPTDTSSSSTARGSSMFERRMLLVGIAMLVMMGAMAARLFSLTVVYGTDNLSVAQSRLDHSVLLPTVRGAVTDRKGRVLAESVPSYDLAVEYGAINGAWGDARAVAAARQETGKAAWNKLAVAERKARAQAKRALLDAELESVLEEVCRITGNTRGELDARLGDIRMQVERMANAVWEKQLDNERERYGEDAEETVKRHPIAEQAEPHVVFTQLETKAAFELRKLADAHPGIFEVLDGTRRVYPWRDLTVTIDRSTLPRPVRGAAMRLEVHGVADHVVGAVREEVWHEDLVRRPLRNRLGVVTDLGGYRAGRDMIGSSGIERTYDDWLRGLRGRITEQSDEGTAQRTEPVHGKDIQLTLDIALQARVQALFDPKLGLARVQQWHYGWLKDGAPKPTLLPYLSPLNGAAVVIDVDSSEILAMVSWPTVAAGEEMNSGERAMREPGLNRAIAVSYPPGSIIKPFVYVGAVRGGAFPVDGTVDCNGYFFGPKDPFGRCWIYRPQNTPKTHTEQLHRALDVRDGLRVSCNIFFFTVADRMGLGALVDWYRGFGLGSPLDTGLARRESVRGEDGGIAGERIVGEGAGKLPPLGGNASEQRGRLINIAIGQGELEWTPVQAANAYATLARGGQIHDAELLRTAVSGRAPRRSGDLGLDPRSCDMVLEGLRQAVQNEQGTGHHFALEDRSRENVINARGVMVWAKTGTAQRSALGVDDDGDGKADHFIKGLDHGWFVGLVGEAGAQRPRYAIAVLLENGGSGGKSAGPIANQIIHALIAEGYLAGDPNASHSQQPPARIGDDEIEPTGGAG